MSEKAKLATVWLDGCSGCHMSFLDIDERILAVAELADLVYSPLVDLKVFPEMVDVTLVEGAVSSEEDYHKIQKVRAHTKVLVSLGDCAVTANVPGMRNPFKVQDILNRAYLENADLNQHIPVEVIPPLRKTSVPVHQVVEVDVFVPGCPPSADTIFYVLTELLAGRKPVMLGKTRFGI
ncbi:MAG: NADP oxidoreductase [Chloroflexi bacterium]|nr:NADP oxidoreductase [Chloroflexota bacterium]MBK6710742.1 NADP oxidoreductase [Chloroflexota bacterium]MBK7917338.1 NADP oxidoreductase [Chloroflexota bacterium]MBK8933126.1 NADP oxidoreductase [Chloroflexota bacterium]MBP6804045.1 NADP oxidoreductase [Chloroflexota bacterium]